MSRSVVWKKRLQNGSLTRSIKQNSFLGIMMIIFFSLIFIERCALSSSICAGKVSTYMHMRILVAFISFGSYILIQSMLPLCKEISYDQLIDPSQWFRWCYKILIHLVISSICHQLASILICRPIDILYDIRFLSMFIVQIIGFFICLLFAFFLGVKYASVKRGNLIINVP